ncbi:hypothetical protein BV22DRAFT_749079 [Leucogyrophana mollusca]|uniref:Uncharacterized protein n=1 Tax=Leucogyrophana mollusca TaxID=85980 RepID=A0ACB8B6T5_9AGAM|nr:hypothetical protein BV22DRAFT_749079 [Leucogyrophana mollusca]
MTFFEDLRRFSPHISLLNLRSAKLHAINMSWSVAAKVVFFKFSGAPDATVPSAFSLPYPIKSVVMQSGSLGRCAMSLLSLSSSVMKVGVSQGVPVFHLMDEHWRSNVALHSPRLYLPSFYFRAESRTMGSPISDFIAIFTVARSRPPSEWAMFQFCSVISAYMLTPPFLLRH